MTLSNQRSAFLSLGLLPLFVCIAVGCRSTVMPSTTVGSCHGGSCQPLAATLTKSTDEEREFLAAMESRRAPATGPDSLFTGLR